MAAAAGSLVVKLGLDAAEYTQGLTKAEYQARQFGEKIGVAIKDGAAIAVASLATIATSAVAAYAAFDALVKKAGDFQDLAEMTGASAEGLASFGVAAGTAGTTVEAVAQASIKLTKNLTGVDDESKAAGAAIGALGLDLKTFKELAPETQIEEISKALAGFKDGASKTAVAQALLGKSGAELLPFLKALEEQGGRQVILTAEQIAQADEYADRQAKSRAELAQHAQALSTEFLPALTAVQNAVKDVITELIKANGAQKDFALNLVILDWAENVALALAAAGEAAIALGKTLRAVGGSFESVFADSKLLAALTPTGAVKAVFSGDSLGSLLAERNAKAKEANDRYVDLWNYDGTKATKAIKKAFEDQRNVIKKAVDDDKSMAFYMRGDKPDLKFDGPTGRGGKGRDTSAQEAKATLAADLDRIKNAQEAITNAYSNQERVLEALRSAGLKDENQYYAEKQRLLAQISAAQEDSLQKQIARMQQEQLTGKDAIDNSRKIADAEAALAKLRGTTATQAEILAIQQKAANDKMAASFLAARQAAQDFFDTTNRGYERAIAGFGQGTKARDFSAGITQIEDKYQEQRRQLQNQRAQAELSGTFGPDAQRQFEAQLAIINEFQSKAIESYRSYYGSLDALSKDWQKGASEALANYATEAANSAKLAEQAFGSAFKGLEDALVEFVKTGKLDFKSLADSIIADIARIVIKQQITGPLASVLGGLFSGGNFGSGLTAAGTSDLTSIIGRASGGPVSAGGLYRVNENGPELLDVNGKQYLMMGNRGGMVTPNGDVGGGGTTNNYFTVGDVATVSMLKQALAMTQAQTAAGATRSQRYGGSLS